MTPVPLLAVAGGAAALAVAGTILRTRARREVASDPEAEVLSRDLPHRCKTVISADGTRLHVEVLGADSGPTVVFVHGWTCSLRFWQYQLLELGDRYRLVAFDLRGHGHSEGAAGGDYSMDALAADLDAVLNACVLDGDVALLVGHSMGAMSIVAWAGDHPEKVRDAVAGAVLVNTGVERLIAEARILLTASALSGIKQVLGRLVLGLSLPGPRRPSGFVQRIVRYVALGPRATPAQVAFCERLFLDCPADVRAGFGATLSELDIAHALHALTVPTVVIAGEHDRLTPTVHSRAIGRALPDAVVVELKGVGHCAPIEAHGEVTGEIRALLDRAVRA
jgi:pimeloyl-ACP methyl ester carboxylesterase